MASPSPGLRSAGCAACLRHTRLGSARTSSPRPGPVRLVPFRRSSAAAKRGCRASTEGRVGPGRATRSPQSGASRRSPARGRGQRKSARRVLHPRTPARKRPMAPEHRRPGSCCRGERPAPFSRARTSFRPECRRSPAAGTPPKSVRPRAGEALDGRDSPSSWRRRPGPPIQENQSARAGRACVRIHVRSLRRTQVTARASRIPLRPLSGRRQIGRSPGGACSLRKQGSTAGLQTPQRARKGTPA